MINEQACISQNENCHKFFINCSETNILIITVDSVMMAGRNQYA